jgi:hypothetical protein
VDSAEASQLEPPEQDARQVLQDALKKERELETRDPLLIAISGALIRLADWMDQTDARRSRIAEELGVIARDAGR